MANEAVPIEGPYEVHDFTVAAGTAIPEHTLMKLTDPRTASASSGADAWAGIAASEKSSDDTTSTSMGCYTRGIFDLKLAAGATCTAGDIVSLSGANQIKEATEAEIQAGKGIGKALETGSSAEVIEVSVGQF